MSPDPTTPAPSGHRDGESAAISRFSGRTAHDLNNLLTILQGYGDLLVEDLAPHPELRQAAEELLAAAVRVGDFSTRLSTLGRQYRPAAEPLDLADFLAERQPVLATRMAADTSLECQADDGEQLAVLASAEDLARLVDELVANAAEAMPSGGRITIDARASAAPELPAALPVGRYCVLRVEDSGDGFTADLLATAAQAYVTTKPRQQGAGLGLSIVDHIAHQLGGTIRLDNATGGGGVVEVYLPRPD